MDENWKDYNTQRDKLRLPEYGRYVQKMVEHVSAIEDRTKRNEQIRAVVGAMTALNPQMRELSDGKQKLWDHVYAISDYSIDIDSPYPVPQKADMTSKPDRIPLQTVPIKASCYGRNIQNMVDVVASREDDDKKREMIRLLGIYMRQQYLIWNKDSVMEETIFKDMERLSGGRLTVPRDVHLGALNGDASQFSRPGLILGGNSKNNRKKQNKGKKWKK